jgi:hypothetical protein
MQSEAKIGGDPFDTQEEFEGGQAMIYLGGSRDTFRCDVKNMHHGICGCNVFTRLRGRKYKCNSCGMVYEAC